MKAELGNRKSQASQMRMKHIANLASDNPNGRKRRRGGNDDDGFGADDADWMIYREIQAGRNDDDEDGTAASPSKVASLFLDESW